MWIVHFSTVFSMLAVSPLASPAPTLLPLLLAFFGLTDFADISTPRRFGIAPQKKHHPKTQSTLKRNSQTNKSSKKSVARLAQATDGAQQDPCRMLSATLSMD